MLYVRKTYYLPCFYHIRRVRASCFQHPASLRNVAVTQFDIFLAFSVARGATRCRTRSTVRQWTVPGWLYVMKTFAKTTRSPICSQRVAQGGLKASFWSPFGHLGPSRSALWSTLGRPGAKKTQPCAPKLSQAQNWSQTPPKTGVGGTGGA